VIRTFYVGLVLASLTGCLPKGYYALQPISPMPNSGQFQLVADLAFDHVPGKSSDLVAKLKFAYQGDQAARINLARTFVRIDGVSWLKCRTGRDFDKDSLIQVIQPNQELSVNLRCKDIARPYKAVELRFETAGIGMRGTVEIKYEGVPAPL
jgi:hypothetical protein